MDGFHLANAELVRLGLRERKGAIESFDGHGYLALLRRIHREKRSVVYAPTYDRGLEEAIAGSIAVDPAIDCVLTEGNYLLAREPPWREVRAELEAVWFLTLADDERRRRLLARHIRAGKTRERAQEWISLVDDANAERIAETKALATFVVQMERLDDLMAIEAPPATITLTDTSVESQRTNSSAGPIDTHH